MSARVIPSDPVDLLDELLAAQHTGNVPRVAQLYAYLSSIVRQLHGEHGEAIVQLAQLRIDHEALVNEANAAVAALKTDADALREENAKLRKGLLH